MHFHPFGIPLDEALFVCINACQTPLTFYVSWAKSKLGSVRLRTRA